MSKYLFLLLVTLTSPWTIKLTAHPLICLLVLLVTIILFSHLFPLPAPLAPFQKFSSFLLLLSLSLLAASQFQTTPRSSLTQLDSPNQLIQKQRLNEYPPLYINLGSSTFWIPLPHWIEERPESVFLSSLQNHFFATLDANHYFFAGHPREKANLEEFEAFPYVFLPFFLLGLFSLLSSKKTIFLLPFAASFTFLSFLSPNHPLGPFLLFPFLAVSIATGLQLTYSKLQSLASPLRFSLFAIISLTLILGIIQSQSLSK